MDDLLEGLGRALGLLARGDREVWQAAWISLKVALTSTAVAATLGIPLGFFVGTSAFRGKRLAVVLLNALMGLPTVVVGLLLYSLLSRRGPLGGMGILYTPWAMILGQIVLATPIIAGLSYGATEGMDPRVLKTARALGAGRVRAAWTAFGEIRAGLLAAAIAGFGRVFSEIGVSLMLGGNIRHYTRSLTTAIGLETARGDFALGFALGLVLLAVAFLANGAFQLLRSR